MNPPDLELLEKLVEDNRDLERLEQLLGEFNLFEAIGVVRQEIRHSDFLRFLLDPSESHGLSHAFLKGFLKSAVRGRGHSHVSVVDIDVADLSDAVVERERLSIDVLVHSEADHLLLAIENKVDSSEHSDQLRRYRAALAHEFPQHTKILAFLSPEGDAPSDPEWLAVSYTEVLDVLDGLIASRERSAGPDVLMALRHYRSVIRRHLVSDSDIAELCRRLYRAHQKAFDLVFEHRPDQLLDLSAALQEIVSAHPLLALDYSTKGYVRFFAREWDSDPRQKRGTTWTKSGRILLFELQNFEESLRLKLIIGPGDAEFRQQLFEFAQGHKASFPGTVGKLYPRWTQIFACGLLTAKDYEASPEDVIELAKGRLGKALDGEIAALIALLGAVFRPQA